MSGCCIVGPGNCMSLAMAEDLWTRPQSTILNPQSSQSSWSLKLESHIRWVAADSAELSFALSAGMATFADDIQKMQLSLLVLFAFLYFVKVPRLRREETTLRLCALRALLVSGQALTNTTKNARWETMR